MNARTLREFQKNCLLYQKTSLFRFARNIKKYRTFLSLLNFPDEFLLWRTIGN